MRNGNVKSELDLNARKRVNRTCKAWTRLLKHKFTQDGWILDSSCSTKTPHLKDTSRKNEICLLVHRDVQKGTDNVDVRLKWKQLYKKIFCLRITFHLLCTPAVRATCWRLASCCFAKAPQTVEAIPGIWGHFWIIFLEMSSIWYFHQLCSSWSDDLLGPVKNTFCNCCGNDPQTCNSDLISNPDDEGFEYFLETCISWSISGIGLEYWIVGGGWFRWSSSMSEIHFSTTFISDCTRSKWKLRPHQFVLKRPLLEQPCPSPSSPGFQLDSSSCSLTSTGIEKI